MIDRLNVSVVCMALLTSVGCERVQPSRSGGGGDVSVEDMSSTDTSPPPADLPSPDLATPASLPEPEAPRDEPSIEDSGLSCPWTRFVAPSGRRARASARAMCRAYASREQARIKKEETPRDEHVTLECGVSREDWHVSGPRGDVAIFELHQHNSNPGSDYILDTWTTTMVAFAPREGKVWYVGTLGWATSQSRDDAITTPKSLRFEEVLGDGGPAEILVEYASVMDRSVFPGEGVEGTDSVAVIDISRGSPTWVADIQFREYRGDYDIDGELSAEEHRSDEVEEFERAAVLSWKPSRRAYVLGRVEGKRVLEEMGEVKFSDVPRRCPWKE